MIPAYFRTLFKFQAFILKTVRYSFHHKMEKLKVFAKSFPASHSISKLHVVRNMHVQFLKKNLFKGYAPS